MKSNLKTTIGGVIALAAVALLVCHKITTESTVVLLGVASGWVGIVSTDAGKEK